MKQLALALLAFTVFGCSPQKEADPKPTTPFGKAAVGSWLSECQQGDQGFYKETLTLDGVSSGSSALEFYADVSCNQSVGRKDAPVALTYSAQEKSATRSTVFVTINGRTTQLEVTLVGNGTTMKVQYPGGATIVYFRVLEQTKPGSQVGNTNGGNGPLMQAFDRLAVGSWISEKCQGGANNQSYAEILIFRGNGEASSMYNLYNNGTCQGTPRTTPESPLSYGVNRFSNGSGEIVMAGEVSTVSIPQPNFMAITNASNVTATYVRIK